MDNLKLIAMVDQVQLQSYDEKSVSWSGIIISFKRKHNMGQSIQEWTK